MVSGRIRLSLHTYLYLGSDTLRAIEEISAQFSQEGTLIGTRVILSSEQQRIRNQYTPCYLTNNNDDANLIAAIPQGNNKQSQPWWNLQSSFFKWLIVPLASKSEFGKKKNSFERLHPQFSSEVDTLLENITRKSICVYTLPIQKKDYIKG